MENPKLEARIFHNLDWEFTGNEVWLIYEKIYEEGKADNEMKFPLKNI